MRVFVHPETKRSNLLGDVIDEAHVFDISGFTRTVLPQPVYSLC
jgi:hypothetical protein